MSTNDPLHYRKPEPTSDVVALADSLERALRGRSGRIGWDGPYDHGDPPSAAQIASSAIPALGQLGWKLVPVAAERSARAAPLDVALTTEARCCGLREHEHPTWPVYSEHPFGWPAVLAKAWRRYFETHMDELKADIAAAHLPERTDR